jgi:hypothetical protein
VARPVEHPVHRMHHLAVHGAAMGRMGMAEDGRGKPAPRIGPEPLEGPLRPGKTYGAWISGVGVHGFVAEVSPV